MAKVRMLELRQVGFLRIYFLDSRFKKKGGKHIRIRARSQGKHVYLEQAKWVVLDSEFWMFIRGTSSRQQVRGVPMEL